MLLRTYYARLLATRADNLTQARDRALDQGRFAYADVLLNEIVSLRMRADRLTAPY